MSALHPIRARPCPCQSAQLWSPQIGRCSKRHLHGMFSGQLVRTAQQLFPPLPPVVFGRGSGVPGVFLPTNSTANSNNLNYSRPLKQTFRRMVWNRTVLLWGRAVHYIRCQRHCSTSETKHHNKRLLYPTLAELPPHSSASISGAGASCGPHRG
ncbi:hypothetical protein H4582DRAFT_1163724 [Lactarius indigo]|nr:hypothetical protein H4582DRAFT_1163724 [Lactarius indigo]